MAIPLALAAFASGCASKLRAEKPVWTVFTLVISRQGTCLDVALFSFTERSRHTALGWLHPVKRPREYEITAAERESRQSWQ